MEGLGMVVRCTVRLGIGKAGKARAGMFSLGMVKCGMVRQARPGGEEARQKLVSLHGKLSRV